MLHNMCYNYTLRSLVVAPKFNELYLAARLGHTASKPTPGQRCVRCWMCDGFRTCMCF